MLAKKGNAEVAQQPSFQIVEIFFFSMMYVWLSMCRCVQLSEELKKSEILSPLSYSRQVGAGNRTCVLPQVQQALPTAEPSPGPITLLKINK